MSHGRIVLVTGANGGLGQSIARAFLAESADNFVWLGVRSGTDATRELVAAYPDRCESISLDVTRVEQWQEAVQTIVKRHERLDVLINNAGRHQDSLLAQMSDDHWRDIVSVNLDGVFIGCRTVMPTMISQRSGRIINIASLSALLAPPGQTNYSAAKAGVIALTQSLAKEVARLGITVNAVCPGYIETEALTFPDDQARKAALSRVPMRRFGQPEEVAAVVRFLACSEAAYVTGSSIKVDGGIL